MSRSRSPASRTTRVTVVATDSKGGTASQTFEVTVTPEPVNQPPVAGPVQLPAVELGIGQSHTIAVARTFTDPEDDRIDFVDPTTSRPDVATVSAIKDGTFIVKGVAVGQATVTLGAKDRDGPGRPVYQIFEVTVTPAPVNLPPVADQELPDVTVGVGQTHSVTLAGAFIDPEGLPIKYEPRPSITRLDVATLSLVQSGSLTITGVQAGAARVTVSATDGITGPGRPAVQFFEVTVIPEPVNQPPGPGDADLPDRRCGLGRGRRHRPCGCVR